MDVEIKKLEGGGCGVPVLLHNTDIDKWVRYAFVIIAISPTLFGAWCHLFKPCLKSQVLPEFNIYL